MSRCSRSRSREAGQVLVLVAALTPLVLGLAGLAVDVGSYLSERRKLQNAADSIVLAASQELPDEAEAIAVAEDWADRNGIDPDEMTLTVDVTSNPPKVHVSLNRSHRFAFVRIVRIYAKDVGARAGAIKVSHGGGDGIVPWAVKQSAINSTPLGEVVTIKYDANNPEQGNFGPIRIDGSDDYGYTTAAKYGSTSTICAATTDGCTVSACPGTFPDVCSETAPECDGPDCRPKTGNMTGPTRTAVDFRLQYTMPECNQFEEVFTDTDGDGTFWLEPDCNPWIDGPGYCDSPTDMCSRRVIIIPVIDDFPNGSSQPMEVQEFALMFLEGYDLPTCTGSSCEISARFVKAELTTGALSGTFNEHALIQFTRLAE